MGKEEGILLIELGRREAQKYNSPKATQVITDRGQGYNLDLSASKATLLFSKILSDCPQNFPSRDAAKSLQSCPTVRPHRQQPTRLPCPWDSPGKNAGVGCHFLLQSRDELHSNWACWEHLVKRVVLPNFTMIKLIPKEDLEKSTKCSWLLLWVCSVLCDYFMVEVLMFYRGILSKYATPRHCMQGLVVCHVNSR